MFRGKCDKYQLGFKLQNLRIEIRPCAEDIVELFGREFQLFLVKIMKKVDTY